MGDVVRTLPAMRALRSAYPDAQISWLVERGAEEVLRDRPELDQVLTFPREELTSALRGFELRTLRVRLSQFVLTLRSQRFDLVVDFHSILKSGVLSRLTGAPTRISYAAPFGREWSWLFATDRARLLPHKISRYDRNMGLVEFMGVQTRASGRSIRPRSDARERIANALGGKEVPVVIHPGSSGGAAYKRYRASGYADLARALQREKGVTSVVTVGTSAEELALAEEIVELSRGAAELAPHTQELGDLIALIDGAGVFVGSDSGPLHIATALGTPAVQILGPTDPIENEPRRGTHWKQVRIPMPCSPCRRGCAEATCMSVIPYEHVLVATLECLTIFYDRRKQASAGPVSSPAQPVAQSWN